MPWDFGQKSAFAEKNREQQQVGFFLEYVFFGQQRNPRYHLLAETEWFQDLSQIQILENARKEEGRLRTIQSTNYFNEHQIAGRNIYFLFGKHQFTKNRLGAFI